MLHDIHCHCSNNIVAFKALSGGCPIATMKAMFMITIESRMPAIGSIHSSKVSKNSSYDSIHHLYDSYDSIYHLYVVELHP